MESKVSVGDYAPLLGKSESESEEEIFDMGRNFDDDVQLTQMKPLDRWDLPNKTNINQFISITYTPLRYEGLLKVEPKKKKWS